MKRILSWIGGRVGAFRRALAARLRRLATRIDASVAGESGGA